MQTSKVSSVQASFKGALLIFLIVSFLLSGTAPTRVSAEDLPGDCPGGVGCLYLPMVLVPPVGDLALYGMEVTQAVQDPNNSVPLVAGRNTMLRIFAKTIGGNQPLSNVKISISASSASSLISGSPSAYATTVPLSYDRTSLQSTINFSLPLNWTNGIVDLTVRLDPDDVIAEADEKNNALTMRFVFQQVEPLKVKIVPIRYVNTKDGHTYPPPSTDTISNWILRTYPVSRVEISWRDAYTFTGNLSLSSDFSRLLSEVTSLKNTDSAPVTQVYYALVPTTDGTRNWFFGGIAGIGWVGSRTAVGLDVSGTSGQIAAHEIGHNLGMLHTPCGDPSMQDINYPYPDGTIGQLGTDVFSGTLYAATSKDFMSYCTPKWISDYTYKILFNAQRQATSAAYNLTAAPTAERGLLLRAEISEDGIQLKPAYVVPGPFNRSPETGDYQVEVLDAHGQVLAVTPVQAYQIELEREEDAHLFGINTIIPLPDQPAAGFRLVKNGEVLAQQALQSEESPAPVVNSVLSAEGQRLRWPGAGQPVLVRYSKDGGNTWTTAGLDVTDGDLLLQAAQPDSDVKFEVIPAGVWK